MISDSIAILQPILEFTQYQTVTVNSKAVKKRLFYPTPRAEIVMMKIESNTAVFALFFYSAPIFLCKDWIYIVNLYIIEKYQGNRYDEARLQYILQLKAMRNSSRVEWLYLDWHFLLRVFYFKLGIVQISDWMVYRVDNEKIAKIAQ